MISLVNILDVDMECVSLLYFLLEPVRGEQVSLHGTKKLLMHESENYNLQHIGQRQQ